LRRRRGRYGERRQQPHANRRRGGVLLAPPATGVAHLVEVLEHHVHHLTGTAAAVQAVEALLHVLRVAAHEGPRLKRIRGVG
jgi:hypothetical protein